MKPRVRIRLASVNAIGFSASTVMPLWLGGIASEFGMPAWFAVAVLIAQLGGAALFNLATPILFRKVALLPLARIALLVAAAAYLLTMTPSPEIFLVVCLISGSALGIVLNVTNRLMGSSDHVQKGYAVFVLIEVFYATIMFLTGAALIARFGLLVVFPMIGTAALVAWLLLMRLPIEPSMPVTITGPATASHRGRAALGLASFALFFIGLATINSFMLQIGEATGLSASAASQRIGLGMPFGFAGAILAMLVGERVRPVVPVVIVVAVLACVAPLLTVTLSQTIFVAGVIALAISTMFSVPYFFAHLGALDRSGRYAALGPAMMLTGLAAGPSVAVLLNAEFGLVSIGIFSSVLIVLGGIAFVLSRQHAPVVPELVLS